MAKHHNEIDAKLAKFIKSQPMFFVATAADEGRVNLSPKGLDGTFAIISPNRVAFLNLTGSGNETAAHLLKNDRITIMFCSFDKVPMILRLYGNARAIHANDGESVSYTHLDVYKRQICHKQNLPMFIVMKKFWNMKVMNANGAVSYTHLDVYKRQA